MIHIMLRGEEREVEEYTTITQLLKSEEETAPESVGIAVNEKLISRENYDSYFLKDGDAVEIFSFLMGGSAE